MIRLAAALLSSLLLTATPPSPPATTPPSVTQYRAAIHQIRVGLDALRFGRGSSASNAGVAAQLRALSHVKLPDGHVIETDLPGLADEVASHSSGSLGDAGQTIDALDTALSRVRISAAGPSNLTALDSVLRDSRFHPSRNPVQRLFDWVGGQIDRLLNAINRFLEGFVPGSPSASLSSFVFAILFLVVVVASAVLIARAVLHRAVIAPAALDEAQEPRTSVAAKERVDRHLAESDYRLALRYLLLATLLRLQDLGALRLRPGLTNREYLRDLERELERAGELAAPMGELMEAFDRTWYGHLPINRGQYERCEERAAEALRAAQRGRVA